MGLKNFIANIGKANAEINSGHEAADAALIAAKITTLKVDGKDIPAAEAPLAVKIAAVSALISSGDKSQDVSELIASNGQIAAQVEELQGKLTVANATISASTQKISVLESELATNKASVQTLTADLTTHKNLLKASNDEASRVTGIANSQKLTLAKRCIAAGCIDFAKDATEADKVAAAEKMSYDDLDKAYAGAVNAAVAKTGVSFATIPSAPATGTTTGNQPKELTGRARFNASIAKDFGKK